MKEFNYIQFGKNLAKDFKSANSLVSKIGDAMWQEAHGFEKHPIYDEEKDFNLERLKDTVEDIICKIQYAYESLGLNFMLKKLNTELSNYENKLDDIDLIHYLDIFHSPVVFILRRHLNTIMSTLDESIYSLDNQEYKISILEQILRGTPKMIMDRNIIPKNEKEVRKEIYNSMIHVFPDTVREIPIAKVSKTYKPDIGVKSLKSAIEYKFVDSETEAKTSIGGIFEDIHGYEGSEDWKVFYAVIYMTDNYLTTDQILAEFKMSNVPHNWKPVIVFGKGERKQKSK